MTVKYLGAVIPHLVDTLCLCLNKSGFVFVSLALVLSPCVWPCHLLFIATSSHPLTISFATLLLLFFFSLSLPRSLTLSFDLTQKGWTPLATALAHGQVDNTVLLWPYEANPVAFRDAEGDNFVHLAARGGACIGRG